MCEWDRGPIGTSRQERRGVGASLNAGCDVAFAPPAELVLYVVDDWQLLWDLDLTPWADLLVERPDLAVMRLGPPHPWTRGAIEHDAGRWFVRLERESFAFATRPALYHARMFETYGRFREGVSAFDVERDYADRINAQAGPDVAIAMPHPWDHIEGVELADIVPDG